MNRSAIAPGVYVDDQGRYWARPIINRRRTWRLLVDNAQRPIRNARTATALALRKQWQPASDNFAALAELYLAADCPNKRLEPRGTHFISAETARCTRLISYFGNYPCDEIRLKLLPAYAAWRRRQCHRGDGCRTVDLDLCTLSNVLHYGVAIGQLELNCIAHNRPRYRKARDVRHSRVLMPASADVIHQLADHLFERIPSETSGWMLLFSLFTGCRTSELRRLRLDAGAEQAGHRTATQLHLGRRSKSGVNPFVELSPDFRAMLDCFLLWHTARFPESPWYFPGRTGECICDNTYCHALARACRQTGLPHTSPHAIRAYFVTLHRRNGVADSVIAAMIGDQTVSLISQTYGDAPQGDNLTFLPANRLPAYLRWQPAEAKIVGLCNGL